MNVIKKYKNIIILISILLIIFSSPKAIEFAKSIAKGVENYFSSSKDYSNLNTQAKKYQSTFKASKPTQSSTTTNTKSSSIFGSSKKKTAEELDQEIMNKKTQNSSKRDIRFNEEQLRKRLNDKKVHDEKFNMDFKELDDF